MYDHPIDTTKFPWPDGGQLVFSQCKMISKYSNSHVSHKSLQVQHREDKQRKRYVIRCNMYAHYTLHVVRNCVQYCTAVHAIHSFIHVCHSILSFTFLLFNKDPKILINIGNFPCACTELTCLTFLK